MVGKVLVFGDLFIVGKDEMLFHVIDEGRRIYPMQGNENGIAVDAGRAALLERRPRVLICLNAEN